MDIVKRLSLNKTPKSVENNSIVAAKNIMIDNTGSFITNEPGFSVAFECPNDGERIVGCIPCAKEIVIFTYQEDNGNNKSRVYRYSDGGVWTLCTTNWNYSGGKIIGAYTYNYKQELIIAVSEYDAFDNNGNKIMVPLKSWNLDTEANVISGYNTESSIPPFTSKYVIGNTGYLLSGVYTFFIRFKISDSTYTKWIQITDDIIIINLIGKESINHHYLNSEGTAVNNTTLTIPAGSVFEVNNNDLSSNNIVLTLDFPDDMPFDEYQIAYVFKRNSDEVVRLKSNYSKTINVVDITNNEYIEELVIDEVLESPHQFYNVKSLINYNNRLYIGNYEEYKNENLQDYADKINVDFVCKPKGLNTDIQSDTSTKQVDISTNNDYGIAGIHQLINVETEIINGVEYIKNPVKFVRKALAENIRTEVSFHLNSHLIINEVKPLHQGVSFSETYNNGRTKCIGSAHKILYICFKHNNTAYNYPIFYSDGFFNSGEIVPDSAYTYKIKIVTDNNSNEQQLVLCYTENNTDYEIKLNSNEFSKPDLHKKPDDIAMFNILTEIRYRRYGKGFDGTEYKLYYWIENGNNPTPTRIITWNGLRVHNYYTENNTQIISKSNNVYNNDRTLIPNQVYALYVHYLRSDYSYTDGFPISAKSGVSSYTVITNSFNLKTFKINEILDNNNKLIFPIFTDIEIPEGYIGCFITYEAIEKTAIPIVTLYGDHITQGTALDTIDVTNTNYIYNDDSIFGNKLRNLTRKIDIPSISSGVITKKEHRNQLTQPYLEVIVTGVGGESQQAYEDEILEFVLNSTSIYTKSTKILYRLTNNIFKDNYIFDNQTPLNGDPVFNHLPGFYNTEKIIYYTDDNDKLIGLIASPAASNIVGEDGNKLNHYKIKLKSVDSYNTLPTNAYSVFQDYAQGAVSLVDDQGRALGVYYNKILSPDKLKTFLELKECYQAKPLKVFSNYSKDHTNTFGKTIYRSNVISDESLINGFREFTSTNYKNIIENKGNITNIIGIGLYLIVHTEYSMFVFDRSPKLTKVSQLDIPDAFAIDYQEVLPSNEGFGGLSTREESILTKQGYIWFDKVNKYIFVYENGQAKIISQDINNFIKHLDIKTIRFAEDVDNNRLLICIYLNPDENEAEYQLTLSYSFITKTFISLHDYTFTHNYRTYKCSYLLDINKDDRRLYIFNKKSFTYQNLLNDNPIYYTGMFEEHDVEDAPVYGDGNYESEHPITQESRAKNYVDIIFNHDYNLPKVLNYISYILSEINSEYDSINVSEEYLNRRFSGNLIEIYTDECYTGSLDVTQEEVINKLEEYKLPYWDKGCWNLNYFRRNINKHSTRPVEPNSVTGEELQQLSIIQYYNKETKLTETAYVNLDKLKHANLYDEVTDTAAPSDNRSLIFGKYFVVRFIFDNDKRFKLDEISFNVNKY